MWDAEEKFAELKAQMAENAAETRKTGSVEDPEATVTYSHVGNVVDL